MQDILILGEIVREEEEGKAEAGLLLSMGRRLRLCNVPGTKISLFFSLCRGSWEMWEHVESLAVDHIIFFASHRQNSWALCTGDAQ